MMTNSEYRPKPAPADELMLPEGLQSLVELMAENVHDTWARQRIADGWRYGTKRDDEQKLHPCLVPYDALPDSEREYDRQTALETVRFIIAQGYEIRHK
ncbi:MAG: Ryanodine receptor Ryr [Tannerella sp.]|jgi:hypothetical protein|nr:Ryanodine receptor Ryr [Tannerella sp.]